MDNKVKNQIIKGNKYILIAFIICVIVAFGFESISIIAGAISMIPAVLLALPYAEITGKNFTLAIIYFFNYCIWLLPYMPGLVIIHDNRKKYKYYLVNIIVVLAIHFVFVWLVVQKFCSLLK